MGWFYPIIYGGMHAKKKGLLHHHICSAGPGHLKKQVVWSCDHARCRKETFLQCSECDLTRGALANLDALMGAFIEDRPLNKRPPPRENGVIWKKDGTVWDRVGYGNERNRK